MNKSGLNKATLITLFLVLCFSGCATTTKKERITRKPEVTSVSILPVEAIDQALSLEI